MMKGIHSTVTSVVVASRSAASQEYGLAKSYQNCIVVMRSSYPWGRSAMPLDWLNGGNQDMPDTYISPPSSAFHEALGAIVGEKGLVTDPQAVQFHTTNWQGMTPGRAAAVVKPATVEEVSAIVKLCNEHNVKIVPQGGLTGLMAAGIPVRQGDEIVVSLARMNRILDVNPQAYTMTVEAGVVLQTIQQTAMEHDRLFPISLGAQGSCMIGGNLSTNAGGAQVLHYGNARNLVMGLEVVLANGDIWNGLRALKKDNTGYDLKHLFMGAEGTLGIITKAVLKLWPAAKDNATAWLAVRDLKAAVEILSEAHSASEDNVESCELMSREATDMVLRHVPGVQDPLKSDLPWYILMQWSSSRPRADGGAQGSMDGMTEKMEQFLADQMEAGR